jgi:hypothetical protein
MVVWRGRSRDQASIISAQCIGRRLPECQAKITGKMARVLEAAFQRDLDHRRVSLGLLQHLSRAVEPDALGESAGE